MYKSIKRSLTILAITGVLAGCGMTIGSGQSDIQVARISTLTAVGYAVVSTQPGKSDAQRRLMAIRAARMTAMRDLAEQIHGLKVDSNTTVVDLMVQNDTFRGVVTGLIRGARTVRINPTGSDTYEIVIEIDQEMVATLISNARNYS
jgi:outer membrane protein FlgP